MIDYIMAGFGLILGIEVIAILGVGLYRMIKDM